MRGQAQYIGNRRVGLPSPLRPGRAQVIAFFVWCVSFPVVALRRRNPERPNRPKHRFPRYSVHRALQVSKLIWIPTGLELDTSFNFRLCHVLCVYGYQLILNWKARLSSACVTFFSFSYPVFTYHPFHTLFFTKLIPRGSHSSIGVESAHRMHMWP